MVVDADDDTTGRQLFEVPEAASDHTSLVLLTSVGVG